ncbi:MAG TPA: L-threonylcarbamoyladenylate synthase [Chthoniobacterales bacterium]|nr:L-threonylcarbamoyladenylate synthase [Chthoniobacterales bacterium]
MKTEILRSEGAEGKRAVAESIRLLREGFVVALPTETVYGLAADALNVDAVLRIFEAKERPRFDPLIVHLPDAGWMERLASIGESQQQIITALTERFWPGPLTLILPRNPIVPDVVTAGLNTVAVRASAHPVFAEIVAGFGGPLAAPSANRFGRISPTTAGHVASELGGRIPLIVDGGGTTHGVESTIVAFRGEAIEILRPGPITGEQLAEFGQVRIASPSARVRAPGQLPSHYAPGTRLVVVDEIAAFTGERARCGLLAWNSVPLGEPFAEVRILSPAGDFREAAAKLFGYLRELDRCGLDLIVAAAVPNESLGNAIMDRLQRAAGQTARPQTRR